MSLTQIRNQINALRRKFAFPLIVLRLRRIADKFCDQWADAQDHRKPTPAPLTLARQLIKNNLRLHNFSSMLHYLERCRNTKTKPQTHEIITWILPNPAHKPTIQAILQANF